MRPDRRLRPIFFLLVLVVAGTTTTVVAARWSWNVFNLGASPGSVGDTTADVVLGQADFDHLGGNNIGPAGLGLPLGVAVDGTGHVYVIDHCNDRVLGWKNAASLSS